MPLQAGVYQHPPGRLSRWGVIDVGLKCPHSCTFCYYSWLNGPDEGQFDGMRRAGWLPTAHLLDLARALQANGFIGFDVTGGEPTLSPGIVALAGEATRLGLAMRVITLGQFLLRPRPEGPLLHQLLAAGLADILLSVHAVDDDNAKRITGGSWQKTRAVMETLDARGFDFCTNTTVFAGNFRLLPEIAAEIAQHRVYVANLIVMNAYYAWSRPGARTGEVQGHYGEMRPWLLDARDRLEEAGIAVNIRYAPLCTVKGAERNLVGITGVRHDPHEWANCISHSDPGTAEAMGRRLPLGDAEAHYPLEPAHMGGDIVARRGGKVFPAVCRSCLALPVCDGIDARYLAERGAGELAPYDDFRGDLLDRERLAYLPAFICKTAPFADARGAASEALAGLQRSAGAGTA